MIKDKALLPSPTPASKTESANELLLLFSLIPTMGTLFLIFAMLLVDRYYGNPKKLLKSDNEIGNGPKEKNRVSQPKKERLEGFDNAASDKLKESDSEKRESLQKPNEETIPPEDKRSHRDYGTFAPPTTKSTAQKCRSFSQLSFFDGHTPIIIELETTPIPSKKKRSIEDIDDSSDSYSFPSP